MAMAHTAFRARSAFYRHSTAAARRSQRAEMPLFQAFLRPSSAKVTDGLCIKDATMIDPACGSGGMFVQSGDFVNSKGMNANSAMTFYGQEKVEYNAQLCLMNMAVHGLSGVIKSGDEANTFYHDSHNLNGCCDYVMANPPFNVDKVKSESCESAGRLPFGLPSVNKKKEFGNANYLWISYFYSYLNERGRAGFVMASSATDSQSKDKNIRENLIKTGCVDVMISVGNNFFYTKSLPCSLWFFDKAKNEAIRDKVLFIDARNYYTVVDRPLNEWSEWQLKNLNAIVWLYRGEVEKYKELIGFTGTPLLSSDNITARTFGGYISVYDFKRAVEDGATVPLYYENRGDKIEDLHNPEITDRILDAIENADLDVDHQEKLEAEFAKEIHLLTAEKRLRSIARDFARHYSDLWTSGKAMFVCLNKVTCVRMYDYVQEYWKIEINSIKEKIKHATQQEVQELSRKLKWMQETEMAVVISQEQNEIQTFKKWGLDIKYHREKMEKRKLDKEFKDAKNPFRVVFVCAMWLTGFDVKCLSCLYLDKPLKAHTLMQTIARANRVAEGKSNGLIIDYVGIVKALRKALADYTANVAGQGGDDPTVDKDLLIKRILETIEKTKDYLKTKDYEVIANGVISWVSAIIGGAFAVFGSYIAIRHENKKIREERMEQSRPFFDLIDYSDPRTIEANEYIFHFSKSDEYSSDKPKIAGNVDNSEKVEFIISKFTVNDNDYHPLFSEMVSKSMCFRVVVHLDSPLENEKVYMHVLDINHNERVYKIIFNDQRITGFEEIR